MRRTYKHDYSYRMRHGKRWERRCRKCIHYDLSAYYKCTLHYICPWLAEMRRCADFSNCMQLSLF